MSSVLTALKVYEVEKNVCKIISCLQQGSRLEGKLMRRDNKQILGPISIKLQTCNFNESCIFYYDVEYAHFLRVYKLYVSQLCKKLFDLKMFIESNPIACIKHFARPEFAFDILSQLHGMETQIYSYYPTHILSSNFRKFRILINSKVMCKST